MSNAQNLQDLSYYVDNPGALSIPIPLNGPVVIRVAKAPSPPLEDMPSAMCFGLPGSRVGKKKKTKGSSLLSVLRLHKDRVPAVRGVNISAPIMTGSDTARSTNPRPSASASYASRSYFSTSYASASLPPTPKRLAYDTEDNESDYDDVFWS